MITLVLTLVFAIGGGWQAPAVTLTNYQLVLLKKGPAYAEKLDVAAQKTMDEHTGYMMKLGADRQSLAAGPFTDNGDLAGAIIMSVASPEKAREIEEGDPAVKAGQFTVEVIPFMAARDAFKLWMRPFVPETVYFGFLNSGPNRGQDTATAERLQKEHLAFMEDQHKQGKLLLAGPFQAEGTRRGLVVYRAASLEEARTRASGDPMIKIGRLALEMHPWRIPKGALP